MAEQVIARQVQRALDVFRRRLSEQFGPELLDLRLFGSVARGEANEDSDVDVFVLLRQTGWTEQKQVLDIAGELWAETGLFISPTVFDLERYQRWRREERPLVMEIDREGIRP